jgi:hypothetical protein
MTIFKPALFWDVLKAVVIYCDVILSGYEHVYLPEDATLCGFTPLMANAQDPIFTSNDTDMVRISLYHLLNQSL